MRPALRYIIFSGMTFLLPFFPFLLKAQDRCGTVQYFKSLHPDHQLHKITFEKWVTERTLPRHTIPGGRSQASLYKIPVVIHVIHNGETVGTGANIPEAQILSQLRVLNEDFTRQNADAVNTPSQFAAVAGSLDIEFVLAKQDPDGLPTTGIVRVDGGRNGWTINDNYTLKDLSYWPAEEYMNIWVCNQTDQFIGYAQHPESDLEGLENSSSNRLTDGVVIWHRAFGSIDDGAFSLDPVFNKGRTTTHEVGHFLGLNHTWGDDNGSCSGQDYVADTPNQADRTQGCPTHPKTDACGDVIMFQNFLDYTDDRCMNLFTQGQVNRMTVVIENSPRRKSLLTSPGLLEPDPKPNDLGIRSIVFPDASVCSNVITPVIELRNYGSNAITSARIRFVLDGTTVETKDFTLSLDPQESVEVSFNSITIPSGTRDISMQILLTNGGTDSGSYNDLESSTVIVPAFGGAPFAENFTTQPSGWITHNPDGQITWEIATAPKETASNKALKLNNYDYEDKIGEIDVFLSPVFDLTSVPAATLTFEVAHARYQMSNDRLQVVVLADCENIAQGSMLYNKAGDALKTAPTSAQAFTPSGEGQWRKELIDLREFVGMDKIQLAFVGINDWGNNIYVDNITLFTEEKHDVALVKLVKPSVVTCADEIAPRLLIQNVGSLLNNVVVEYSLNNAPVQSINVANLNAPFGWEEEIDLPLLDLVEGENMLAVTLKDPNGLPDFNTADNSRSFSIVVNQSQDRIPLRENFESEFTPAWTVVNPTGGMKWELANTNFGQSLYFNGFSNELLGDEAWLVSPVLDFSRTSQASMLFDLSFAKRLGRSETLTILSSTDCGATFQEVSYNFPEEQTVNSSWLPQDENDWARNVSVNLNILAGQENARIAFVVRNENANNLYIDNIEFFVTADPDPIEITEVYSIYGYDLSNPHLSDLKITFNLSERQDVRFTVVNTLGQMETDGILPDVLNQTYPLNLSTRLAPGVYFIRVEIEGAYYSSKILVF